MNLTRDERSADRNQAHRNALLRQSVARMDWLFAAAPAGLGFLDAQLRFMRVNEALARLNGLPLHEHVGRPAEELLPPAVAARLLPALRQVLRRGEGSAEVALQVRLGSPSSVRELQASCYPVLTPEGEPFGAGVLVMDVTALREASEFRERLLGIVSHDLRNPLQNVLLSADRLLAVPMADERRRDLQRIRRNVRRMDGMIRDLQELTRARHGGLFVEPSPMELAALCEGLVEEWRALHPERHLRLVARGDTRGCWDAQRLTQLLLNLVSNAFDYSPEGTEVLIELTRAEGSVCLAVSNQGGPISERQRELLFDPFQRARPGGHRSHGAGLGLGLYIVQQIARAHGGGVDCVSADGRVTFAVTLPVDAEAGPGLWRSPREAHP